MAQGVSFLAEVVPPRALQCHGALGAGGRSLAMARASRLSRWLVFLELVVLLPTSCCFKVIGAGLAGSGLRPLASALRALGLRCYRGPESPDGLAEWDPLLRQKSPESLQQLAQQLVAAGYDAILDWPLDVIDVLLQLLERFPDARVILTVHEDSNKWFSAFQQTQASWYYYCWAHDRNSLWELVEIHQEALRLPAVPSDKDAGRCVAAYDQHNAMVREAVPPGQLLELHMHSGWEPLCRFLNVSVPSTDFPWTDAPGSDFPDWDVGWLRTLVLRRYALYALVCGAFTVCAAALLHSLLLPRLGSLPRRGFLLCVLGLSGLLLLRRFALQLPVGLPRWAAR
uniref:Uncharacterized protein n=1 Tax=Alexandrium monilatum TaxID=311494 RepID=A0A7S4T744_9DINO